RCFPTDDPRGLATYKGRVSDPPDAKHPARLQIRPDWIPAFAGMTEGRLIEPPPYGMCCLSLSR
ncbi:MAG: hypothetical protein OXG43_11355, partial [Chloroflexi bacterium]|nr:hypothetical protein [Chloroflexota bacterium]